MCELEISVTYKPLSNTTYTMLQVVGTLIVTVGYNLKPHIHERVLSIPLASHERVTEVAVVPDSSSYCRNRTSTGMNYRDDAMKELRHGGGGGTSTTSTYHTVRE